MGESDIPIGKLEKKAHDGRKTVSRRYSAKRARVLTDSCRATIEALDSSYIPSTRETYVERFWGSGWISDDR